MTRTHAVPRPLPHGRPPTAPVHDYVRPQALGCLVYELCALQPPFDATNQLALAGAVAVTGEQRAR